MTVTSEGLAVSFITQVYNADGSVTLTIQTNDLEDLGSHEIDVTWTLSEYSGVTYTWTQSVKFAICVTPDAIEAPTYVIWDSALSFSVDDFKIEPAEFFEYFTLTYTYA